MLKQVLVTLLVATACAQEEFEDRGGCMYRRFDDLVFKGMPKELEVPRLLKFAMAIYEVTPMNISDAFHRCNCYRDEDSDDFNCEGVLLLTGPDFLGHAVLTRVDEMSTEQPLVPRTEDNADDSSLFIQFFSRHSCPEEVPRCSTTCPAGEQACLTGDVEEATCVPDENVCTAHEPENNDCGDWLHCIHKAQLRSDELKKDCHSMDSITAEELTGVAENTEEPMM